MDSISSLEETVEELVVSWEYGVILYARKLL
jgi:hypothetical protein